jgi:pimeloyl-ACP methyl ester carboxylesterase
MTSEQQTTLERSEACGISFVSATGGKGMPLVMLHGIGSNAATFAPLMRVLAGVRPLLAWDAPGYGGSAPLPSDWPMATDYADKLAALLDHLGHPRVDVLGQSLGAMVAATFAARFPEKVAHLYLVSPALGYGTKPGEALAKGAADRLNGMLDEGAERFAATRGPRLVHRPHDKPGIAAAVVAAMAQVKMPGYQQASRMLSCGDLIAVAGRIAIKSHVIVGADDQITPPPNCRRLYDALVEATPMLGHRFDLVADAGHAVCQEQPAEIARLVMEY